MARLDPVTLSVLASALAGIAEEMGAVLIRGSYSSNIKERRDCSTALFDAEGSMVAQAEHIPVHLGAMPEAVAAIMRRDPEPGDVFAINDPYSGGTHLPDITLVSPVAYEGEIIGYAVTRAHHSDVGGYASRLHAQRLARDLPGGHHHPACPPGAGRRVRRRRARPAARQRPHPRPQARRPARPDRREQHRRRTRRGADGTPRQRH